MFVCLSGQEEKFKSEVRRFFYSLFAIPVSKEFLAKELCKRDREELPLCTGKESIVGSRGLHLD